MSPEEEHKLTKLLIGAQKGQRDDYSLFLKEITLHLTPFIKRKSTHPEFVDDILQDTLVAIHQSRHTYLPGRSLAAWVFVICDHRIIDFYRKYRRLEKRESSIEGLKEEFKEINELGLIQQLEEALSSLPEKQRSIIEMMKLEGLTVKEIALKIGMSESAIKVSAFRGYQSMKRMLGVQDDEK